MNASVNGGRLALIACPMMMMIVVCAAASALLGPVTGGSRGVAVGSAVAVQAASGPTDTFGGLPWG
jgi:hypothetical protein